MLPFAMVMNTKVAIIGLKHIQLAPNKGDLLMESFSHKKEFYISLRVLMST